MEKNNFLLIPDLICYFWFKGLVARSQGATLFLIKISLAFYHALSNGLASAV